MTEKQIEEAKKKKMKKEKYKIFNQVEVVKTNKLFHTIINDTFCSYLNTY